MALWIWTAQINTQGTIENKSSFWAHRIKGRPFLQIFDEVFPCICLKLFYILTHINLNFTFDMLRLNYSFSSIFNRLFLCDLWYIYFTLICVALWTMYVHMCMCTYMYIKIFELFCFIDLFMNKTEIVLRIETLQCSLIIQDWSLSFFIQRFILNIHIRNLRSFLFLK